MGFKAKARKHRKDGDADKAETKKKSNAGELPCAIKGCEKFADKKLGGRSLSLDNALDMWGESNFTPSKAEYVFVNHVIDHGRRKIRMMILTDFTFSFTLRVFQN